MQIGLSALNRTPVHKTHLDHLYPSRIEASLEPSGYVYAASSSQLWPPLRHAKAPPPASSEKSPSSPPRPPSAFFTLRPPPCPPLRASQLCRPTRCSRSCRSASSAPPRRSAAPSSSVRWLQAIYLLGHGGVADGSGLHLTEQGPRDAARARSLRCSRRSTACATWPRATSCAPPCARAPRWARRPRPPWSRVSSSRTRS
jgi:hypothetical protein